MLQEGKLDMVSPIDSRPYTSQLHNFVHFFYSMYLSSRICYVGLLLRVFRIHKILGAQSKNPTYRRQSISQPMRIVAPIPWQGGPRRPQNKNFLKNKKNHPKHENSKRSKNKPKLPEVSYPSESAVPTMFCLTKNTPNTDFLFKLKKIIKNAQT